jgi:hypothetical protein
MPATVGYQYAARVAARIINEAHIVGQKSPPEQLIEVASHATHGFVAVFDRELGVEACLDVFFKPAPGRRMKFHPLTAHVVVDWPAARRTLAEAVSAVALYRQVCDVAALVQCTLDRLRIVDRRETPGRLK